MAQNTTYPTESEVLEALQEYFAPDGSETFEKFHIRVSSTDGDGNRVEKIITDAQIVLEGTRSRMKPEGVTLFDFVEEYDDDEE